MDMFNTDIYNEQTAIGQYGNITNALLAIDYFNGELFDGFPTDGAKLNELIDFSIKYEKLKKKPLVINTEEPSIFTKIKKGKLKVKFKYTKTSKSIVIQVETRPSVRCNECARKKKKCERKDDDSICYSCQLYLTSIESSNLDDIVKKIKKVEIINSCLNPSHVRKSPNKKII